MSYHCAQFMYCLSVFSLTSPNSSGLIGWLEASVCRMTSRFDLGGFTIAALALAAVRPVFEPILLITKLASFFLPSFDFELQLVKLQELHRCI